MCLEQCNQFLIWAHVVKHFMTVATDNSFRCHLKRVYDIIIEILQLLCSEGYCYFLDYCTILFYPPGNRVVRFPPIVKTKISDLSEEESYVMTGLSTGQLTRLSLQLRIPGYFLYEGRRRFKGEECLLHYLVFNRIGETKLRMSRNYFGGDPRRFTYSIRIMTNHLYGTFYHKISGDSMRIWMPHINSFRRAI